MWKEQLQKLGTWVASHVFFRVLPISFVFWSILLTSARRRAVHYRLDRLEAVTFEVSATALGLIRERKREGPGKWTEFGECLLLPGNSDVEVALNSLR